MMRLNKLINNIHANNNPVMPEDQSTLCSSKLNKNQLFPLIAVLTITILWVAIIIVLLKKPIFPIIHDIPLFHYMSQQILDGKIPYKDFFDINPPGAYIIHLFVLVFLGRSDEAWTTFIFLWMACTSLLAGLYCWRISRISAFLVPALFVCSTILIDAFSFGQRDCLLVLPILLASHLFTNVIEMYDASLLASKGKQLFGCGVSLGFATSIKPTPIVLLLLFSIVLLFTHFQNVRNRTQVSSRPGHDFFCKILFLEYLLLFLGAAVPIGLFTLWLLINGGFLPFAEIMLNYNGAVYITVERLSLFALIQLMKAAIWPAVINLTIIVVGCFAIQEKKYLPRISIAILVLAFSGFHYVFQGKGWHYHIIPFSMFALLLQSVFCGILFKRGLAFNALGLTWLLVSVSINMIQLNNQTIDSEKILLDRKPAVPLLVEDLSHLGISANDGIQVMDATEGGLHALFLLGLRQATPYLYDLSLIPVSDNAYIQHLQKDFIDRLEQNPPKWIVFFNKSGLPETTGIARLKPYPRLLLLLDTEYHSVSIREFYIIFERNP